MPRLHRALADPKSFQASKLPILSLCTVDLIHVPETDLKEMIATTTKQWLYCGNLKRGSDDRQQRMENRVLRESVIGMK